MQRKGGHWFIQEAKKGQVLKRKKTRNSAFPFSFMLEAL